MERRDLLKTVAAAAVAAISTAALAEEHDHQHHHEAAMKFAGLAASSGDCLQTGEVCMAHCLVLLSQGEKEMAACARSVNELLAVCSALQKLANQESKNTPRFARLAADVCADCEKECRKHEKKHAECKACADSCAACLKECQKLAA